MDEEYDVGKVLIENYCVGTRKAVVGFEEIKGFNFKEFVEILDQISGTSSPTLFPIRVITKYYIFTLRGIRTFEVEENIKKVFGTSRSYKKPETKKLEDITYVWYFNNKPDKKIIKSNDWANWFPSFISIILLLYLLCRLSNNSLIINIIIILLLIISSFTLVFSTIHMRKTNKEPQKISIQCEVPIIGHYKPFNIAHPLVITTQALIYGITIPVSLVSYDLNLLNILFWCIIPIMIVIYSYLGSKLYIEYANKNHEKTQLIRNITQLIVEKQNLMVETKDFYLHLLLELERKPIIIYNNLQILYLILTFVISIIAFL